MCWIQTRDSHSRYLLLSEKKILNSISYFYAKNSGFLVDFISVPVTSAFTSATSIIIIGAQLKNLLGISYSSKGFADSIYELFIKIDESQFWDAMLGLGCCIFLLALRVSAIASRICECMRLTDFMHWFFAANKRDKSKRRNENGSMHQKGFMVCEHFAKCFNCDDHFDYWIQLDV